MAAIASIKIERWGIGYVVVAYFYDLTIVNNKTFNNYYEALAEMSRIVGREVIKEANKK